MAAFASSSKGPELSKAEYLKRYLSADEDANKSKGKLKKKRRKVPEKGWVAGDVLIKPFAGRDFLCVRVKLAEVAPLTFLKLHVLSEKCLQRYETHFYSLFFRLKIVDDDIDWKLMVKEEKEIEEEEDEEPVVRIWANMAI